MSISDDKLLEQSLKSIGIKTNPDPFGLPDQFIYDPIKPIEGGKNKNSKVRFSQILDFSFPEDIEGGIAEVGEVIYIGDGVCRVIGLSKAEIEDIINVKTSKGWEKALILGIEDTHIESVVLGDYSNIKQGDQVIATNSRLKVPVGKSLFGRVMSPLGVPIDGLGKLNPESYRDVEFPAPSVMEREPIFEP
ncbi:hypothetical protein COX08_00335, partial [Candidatus Beckwithbacteria bacterium CG23_combo_of_CG06-09_8_20_14_all_34_8]